MLQAYGISDKGPIRPANEDWFAIREDLGLCAVADGMGGHNAGEVAARLAVDGVIDFFRDQSSEACAFGLDATLSDQGNRLRTAILLANLQVLEAALVAADLAGMGTTLVVARIADGRLTVGHVGDSRLYLAARTGFRQLTHDDSWLEATLAHHPAANRVLLQHHPMRNALTNVIGAHPRTDVHVREETLSGGELLLLSTDGIHGALDERRLRQLMTEDDEPRTIAGKIVEAARARGSRDNCTAVVARYAAD